MIKIRFYMDTLLQNLVIILFDFQNLTGNSHCSQARRKKCFVIVAFNNYVDSLHYLSTDSRIKFWNYFPKFTGICSKKIPIFGRPAQINSQHTSHNTRQTTHDTRTTHNADTLFHTAVLLRKRKKEMFFDTSFRCRQKFRRNYCNASLKRICNDT